MGKESHTPIIRELKTGLKVTAQIFGEVAKPIAKYAFDEYIRSRNRKKYRPGRKI